MRYMERYHYWREFAIFLKYMLAEGEVMLLYYIGGYFHGGFRTFQQPYEFLTEYHGLLIQGFVYTESLISPKLLI